MQDRHAVKSQFKQLLGAVPVFKYRPIGQLLHLEAVPSKQLKHVASQLPHVFVE
jgi:hypothetical protein